MSEQWNGNPVPNMYYGNHLVACVPTKNMWSFVRHAIVAWFSAIGFF
jgi:hypothetical protein